MGSLTPGWEEIETQADFKHRGQQKKEQLPEWLKALRTDGSPVRTHSTNLDRTSSSASGIAAASPHSRQAPRPAETEQIRRKRMHLKRSSMPVELSSQSPPEGLLAEHIDWWKMVDSSIINEKPGADEPEKYRHGNYVPQHTVAKKHIEDAGAPEQDSAVLARDSVDSTQVLH